MKVKDLLSTLQTSHPFRVKFIDQNSVELRTARIDSQSAEICDYADKDVKFWYPFQHVAFFGADICICLKQ